MMLGHSVWKIRMRSLDLRSEKLSEGMNGVEWLEWEDSLAVLVACGKD